MPPLASSQFYRLKAGLNQQVTSSKPSQRRSESVVDVNPTNPMNIICGSKKFINPQQYTLSRLVARNAVSQIRNVGAAQAMAELGNTFVSVAGAQNPELPGAGGE